MILYTTGDLTNLAHLIFFSFTNILCFLFKIITTYKMFNLDDITVKNDNKDWPYRKLIIGPSGSGRTKYLLNSIQKDNNIIDKIYLYAKDLEKPKCQLLIKKREQAGLKNLKDQNAFIEYSNNMDNIYENIEDKKAQQVLKDLFIRCRKLNISLCFLTRSYLSVLKDVRLNCTHYIIFKLNNKREIQNIAINHSADIDYKDFINIYKKCVEKPYNFLTIDTTQPVDKKFIKNFNDPL